MFRELFESTTKDFYLYRPRPNSKKWAVKTKKPQDGENVLVSLNLKNYSIDFDGEEAITWTEKWGTEWINSSWSWADISKPAGERITAMINKLKENNV